MLGQRVGRPVGIEAAGAGAHHNARAEGRETPQAVNHARPSEVEQAAAEEQIVFLDEGGGPAAGPGPVHDDRVDERGERDGVNDVGVEVDALGHGPGDHGGRGGREGPLEHPYGVLVAVGEGGVAVGIDDFEGGALEGEICLGADEASCRGGVEKAGRPYCSWEKVLSRVRV